LLPRIASAHAENYFVAADRAFQKLERSLARACEREAHRAATPFRRVA